MTEGDDDVVASLNVLLGGLPQFVVASARVTPALCVINPDDVQERERVFRQKKLLYKIRRCKISKSNPLQSRLAYIVYKCWPMSVKRIERKIRQLIVLTEPTHTVCNMTEAGPKMKGCFPAEDIASSVDIEFEGKQYKTMVGYKDYLERTYGDYMTLPPVEQRVTHHFEAYWV